MCNVRIFSELAAMIIQNGMLDMFLSCKYICVFGLDMLAGKVTVVNGSSKIHNNQHSSIIYCQPVLFTLYCTFLKASTNSLKMPNGIFIVY